MAVSARANPNNFYIGIDANVEPLKKPSTKATRKPAKGGLSNVLFVQAAVEDLPRELDAIANEIHINFPWGSLLRAVLIGDPKVIAGIRHMAAAKCHLSIVIGIDNIRDRSEIERLGLPPLDDVDIQNSLVNEYRNCGFQVVEIGKLTREEWSRLETSWARRLSPNDNRSVRHLKFRAI